MSGSPALRHELAGRIEPTHMGVRLPEANAVPGAPDDVPFSAAPQRIGALELSFTLASGEDAWELAPRVRNRGEAPVALAALRLGFRWSPPGQGALRFLRNGWHSCSSAGTRPLETEAESTARRVPMRARQHAFAQSPADREGWHDSMLVTVVGRSPAGSACLVGSYERGLSFGVVYVRAEGANVRLELEHQLDVVLAPGEELQPEIVRVALGDDASPLLEQYADAYGRAVSARVARPFASGWSSWHHDFPATTEDHVRRNLEALTAARDEIPVDVVRLEDGYQRAVGDWLETNERFPSGLASLAAEIRDAGFVPGLWSAPFCVVGGSDVLAAHSGWLMRDASGPVRSLVRPDWSADGSVFVLDAGRDEVQAHLESVYRELVQMGFAHLYLDLLYAAALPADASQSGLTRAGRLRRGLVALRRGAGEEAFLLAGACPPGPSVGIVDGIRVAAQVVAPGRPLDPGNARRALWEMVRSAVARAWSHRRLWVNDPGVLLVGGDESVLGADARSALAAVVGTTGGAAFFADPLPTLEDAERKRLRTVLDHARVIDRAGIPGVARAPALLAPEAGGRVVAGDSDAFYLGLVNSGDEPQALSLDGLSRVRGGEAQERLGFGAPLEDGACRLSPGAGALVRVPRDFRLAVFCDFDGTFSVQDVGSTLAQRHAADRRPAAWARYERGEVTPWEYNLEILDGLDVPEGVLDQFLSEVELDPGARDLLSWCDARGVPFRILSDGFDWNLGRLQVIHGVRFAYDANRLHYEAGRWRIRAGSPDPSCGCGTGTCKGGILRRFRALHPHATLVHIGNGRVSDTCGALEADRALAKDSLASELERRGVAYAAFDTLHDAIPVLEEILDEAVPSGG